MTMEQNRLLLGSISIEWVRLVMTAFLVWLLLIIWNVSRTQLKPCSI